MGLAGLFAVTDFSAVAEDEYHDWYDLEHLPERLRIRGFLGGARWIAVDNRHLSIGTYDLSSLAVLQSAEYLAIAGANASPWSKRVMGKCGRVVRIAADQILPGPETSPPDAGGMMFVAMNVAPEAEAEFNDWFDTEHVPALKAIPGVLSARRFKAPEGSHRYVAFCHLLHPDLPASPAWKQTWSTPSANRLKPFWRDELWILGHRYGRG